MNRKKIQDITLFMQKRNIVQTNEFFSKSIKCFQQLDWILTHTIKKAWIDSIDRSQSFFEHIGASLDI
jgi:hypothetical protein